MLTLSRRCRSICRFLSLVLALWIQVQATSALELNITAVKQCEPVVIRSTGKDLRSDAPANLTVSIIPVNDTAFVFPLANLSTLSNGVALNFFPFPSGSQFVASLDDNSTGTNVIDVSDLMSILPSANHNSSCLPPSNLARRHFQLPSILYQCETFTVSYNTTVVFQAPRIRLYNPKGPAFTLQPLTDDVRAGKATYRMTFFKNQTVILLLEGGKDVHESSPMFTIQGNSTTDSSCLNSLPRNITDEISSEDENDPQRTAVIVGGVLGGSTLLLIIIFMARFIIRDRRKRRRRHGVIFDSPRVTSMSPSNEKQDTAGHELLSYGFRENNSQFPLTRFDRGTDLPQDSQMLATQPPIRPAQPRRPPNLKPSQSSAPSTPIEQLDIESLLNLATIQAEFDTASIHSTASSVVPAPTLPMNSPMIKRVPSASSLSLPKSSSPQDSTSVDSPVLPLSSSLHVRSISLPYTPSTRSNVGPSPRPPIRLPIGPSSFPSSKVVLDSPIRTETSSVSRLIAR